MKNPLRSLPANLSESARLQALPNLEATIIDALPDAVIITTPEGIVMGWNPAAERLFGFTAGEVMGMPVSCSSSHRYNRDRLRYPLLYYRTKKKRWFADFCFALRF